MTQADDLVRMKLILQIIKDISRILQKLPKFFNGIGISSPFSLPKAGVLSVIFTLSLNNALLPGKLTILPLLSKAGLYL